MFRWSVMAQVENAFVKSQERSVRPFLMSLAGQVDLMDNKFIAPDDGGVRTRSGCNFRTYAHNR